MSSTAGLIHTSSNPPLPHTCTTDKRWRAPEKHHWTLIGPLAVCLQSKQVCGWCIQHGTALHPAASGQTRDVHCSHQIQSASRSDGGSASRDNLYSSYSPECQRSPGHIDEPQRQIPREDPVTKTAIRKRPLESVEPLQSDFAAVGTNSWFVWLEWNCPPTEPGFSPLSPISFGSLLLSPLTCLVGDTSFPAISLTWLHRYYLNWAELDDAITKCNNEMPSTENWVLNLVILHYWHTIFIVQLLCNNL